MKIRKTVLLVAILLISVLTFYGCPKKAEVTTTPEAQQEEMDRARAAEEEQRAREEAARAQEEAERAAAAQAGLKPVYFDFDRSHIRQDERTVMKENAEWLKSHPDVNVKIEGNADERGTIEYNQALGQRRAQSAKKYLTDLGISSRRISTISYGKEKPVCTQSTEECWQENRRADFVAE